MDTVPKLAPYWYTLEFDPSVRFHLRPITQPQLAEIESMIVDGILGPNALCRAAKLSIMSIEGMTNVGDGSEAVWPVCYPWIPVDVMTEVGASVYNAVRPGPATEDGADVPGGGSEKNSSSQSQ